MTYSRLFHIQLTIETRFAMTKHDIELMLECLQDLSDFKKVLMDH